jgi:hypothetical protein
VAAHAKVQKKTSVRSATAKRFYTDGRALAPSLNAGALFMDASDMMPRRHAFALYGFAINSYVLLGMFVQN